MGKWTKRFPSDLELIDLYLNGKFSCRKIAQEIGCSHTKVKDRLRLNHIELRPRALQLSMSLTKQLDEDRLRNLYISGMSLENISHTIGIARPTIVLRMHKMGVPLRHRKLEYGRIIKSGEYNRIYLPDHPRAGKFGYIQYHIYVWEKAHNKRLPTGWVIHHLNGIKKDNRPENLDALKSRLHMNILGAKSKRILALENEVKALRRKLQLTLSV